MTAIELTSLNHGYGSSHKTFENFGLTIGSGEFVVLVGPSGCGKSTLLRLIAGLEKVQSGLIRFGGEEVTQWSPRQRNIAMVFQNYALYPHMTVRANLELTLKISKVPAQERARRVQEVADYLEIADQLSKKPAQLSGGQRQRVAMGRALVRSPSVFLFDEPLSNLDAELRTRLRAQIKKVHARFPATKIYVTHDQVEAMTLADRIVVLKDGMIQQIGTPADIYDRPKNVFVAQFFGSPAINLLESQHWTQEVRSFFETNQLSPRRDLLDMDNEFFCGLRPEHILARPFPLSGDKSLGLSLRRDQILLQGIVKGNEHLGAQRVLDIETPLGSLRALVGSHDCQLDEGQGAEVVIHPGQMMYFRKKDGVVLPSTWARESQSGRAHSSACPDAAAVRWGGST